ncbi:hypothetical protein BDP27DRAFT_1426947 [Rhodocollybia butyracea]|uniref:Uncharacterized protein n=1 Tax=Rhodocollybia butyracea TaxID=206335 RepID=A0A9P5PHF4_9AGAR|nr:hypothetical protein BDP27DRAFT_1426947 [Rhodocollybia butyracea]
MPSDRELAPPRLRQYGRRNRTRSPTYPTSSSHVFQNNFTRQSAPAHQRRSARLLGQQRSGDAHSAATELSNDEKRSSSTCNTAVHASAISSHCLTLPAARELQALQREAENILVQFSALKNAQRERFTCPIFNNPS